VLQETPIDRTQESGLRNLDRRLRAIEDQLRTVQRHTQSLCAAEHVTWRCRLRRFLAMKLVITPRYAPIPIRIPRSYRRGRIPDPAPAISIVTPSYNQGRFVERTLQSVLEQDYPRLEFIVQDGGSKDETEEILDRYSCQLTHCESVRDRGQAHALNLGFRHATGEILAYLNSDDLLLPGALAYVADFFARHPEVDVVYGHRVVIDEEDGEVGRWVLPRHDSELLSWADYVPQETLFWRRRIWDKIGAAMDESFQFALDWDLLLRFRDAGARFVRLPRFLGAFRVHARQKTTAEMDTRGIAEFRRLRRRCHGRHVFDTEVDSACRGFFRRHFIYHKLYRLGLLRY
jgi:glycosyltransferase involved in cell wall biosynthesis